MTRTVLARRAAVGNAGLLSRQVAVRALMLLASLGAAAGGTAAQSAQPASHTASFDLVLLNGRVFDGAGNPWFRADVGIRDGRIAAIGALESAQATRTLDVDGLYIAPGFIDAHSHAGPALATPGLSAAQPLLAQGITTVFVNPDGGGPVDLVAQREGLLRDGLGVNVGLLVPHGSVRREVLGMAARAPDPGELARMQELVRAGMRAGAFGLSSGPFYAPGSFSETPELVALARAAAEFGGVYTSHIRDESDYTIGLVAAVDEVITVARESGLRGIVTHVKALGPNVWGFASAIVHRIDAARAAGVEVFADQYPYDASQTGLGAALLPRWAQEGGGDSLAARLRDPATRARIRTAMIDNLARRGGADRIQLVRYRTEPSWDGRRLGEIARARGIDPLDLALEIFDNGGVGIVSFNMHADDITTLMRQPWTMTASDGSLVPVGEGVPHPRGYGTFPRKLGHYARDLGVVGVEDAIRSMTSLPAAVLGLHDRGIIRAGAVADIVVFDLAAIADPANFENPHQLARGMRHVLVGGRFAVEDGEFAGELHGDVLRAR